MAKNKLDTYKNYLGYDGKKINIDKALSILDEIGINSTNEIGETPLIIAAYLERIEVLKRILKDSPDVDYKVQGSRCESALLEACAQRRIESIKLLIDAGADLEQEDRFGLTPLSKIFTNTFSDPIPCAEYLISKGSKITEKVIKMGLSWNQEKFLSFLNSINYQVDSRLMDDKENTIINEKKEKDTSIDIKHIHNIVNQKNYAKTVKIIWQKLVPRSGQAETVQGELLRAIEKLRDEAQRNGNGNFNKNCHKILLKYLSDILTNEMGFSDDDKNNINDDLNRLSQSRNPYLEDDLYDRITEKIIDWYLLNPEKIRHTKNEKLYC